MKIKVGDTVIITTGSRADKRKTGKVIKTFADTHMVLVEGINLKKKSSRGESGTNATVSVEYPIHVSNVMFYDEKAKTGSRLGHDTTGEKKQRVTKKSGTTLK